ncbi:MAG: DUF1320 domain-containing protein [Magnetococcus sp. XQGC-1]
MSYATPQHLLLWFGSGEMTAVAVPDDRPPIQAELLRLTLEGKSRSDFADEACATADLAVARIQAALEEAGRLLDSYLATRYPLPLSTAVIEASPLPRACSVLALSLLYDEQLPKAVEQRHKQVITWLRAVAAGHLELAPTLAQTERVAHGPDHIAGIRLFDEKTLREFMG